MGRYAANTAVPVERSQTEIERTLMKYGADQFAYARNGSRAMIGFSAHGRRVRFELQLPDPDDFQTTPTGRQRRGTGAASEWQQACRQRWRSLALSIKARLAAVEDGIDSFEDAFLSHIVLPSGETVGSWMTPQIDQAYASNRMPALLPASCG